MSSSKARIMAILADAKKTPETPKQKEFLKQLGPSKGGCDPATAMAILDELEGKTNALPAAAPAGSNTPQKLPVRPAKETGNPLPKTRPSGPAQAQIPPAGKARVASTGKTDQTANANARVAVGKPQNKPATPAPAAASKPGKTK